MDQGVTLVLATTVATSIYLGLAIANHRRGRVGVALARLFAALLFGGVTFYLAVVEMRLF